MPRYFNKVTKTEARERLGQVNGDCVALPDDHPFWFPVPTGKMISFDAEGLPFLANYQASILELCGIERAWRDAEISKVVKWLDQVRNDRDFGSLTYSQPWEPEQLNAYRVALCEYPESENFPNGVRPNIDDFASPD